MNPLVGYVANTHHDWFDFLAQRRVWDEVNFWNPSAYYAFRGAPGSPFFFRLKSPRNMIGGFGIVARFDRLPEWLAWECFGQGNGAETIVEFQTRLRLLREVNAIESAASPQIGCIVLSAAVFFPEPLWILQPADWGRQNLRYKSYSLADGEGLRIWRECQERSHDMNLDAAAAVSVRSGAERYGPPTIIRPRLGQGTFRLAVTEAYSGACAATGEHSLPALEAAHIRPYGMGGEHAVSNGILLRSDIHKLFDYGYLTVTPERRIAISPRLRADYDNGRTYYPLDGKELSTPRSTADLPATEHLLWHNEQRFKAA